MKQAIEFLFGGSLKATIQAPKPMPAEHMVALLQEWIKRSADGPDKFFEWLDSETKKGDHDQET